MKTSGKKNIFPEAQKQKIGILSLGCPRNLTDAETFLGHLADKGFAVVEMDQADIGIINTCCFIDEAKAESIDAILDMVELKKEGKLKKIIVCGCLPQRYGSMLKKELPEIDAFVGTPSLNHSLKRYPLTPKHFAYLKICEGCVHACSYCVIPKIKGKFCSIDEATLLERVGLLNAGMIKELNIIGQDITGYGIDLYKSRRLPGLLDKISKKAQGIHWIRLLYLYPDEFIEKILKLMAQDEKFCKYIDLPIQHINDRILRLMNRRSSASGIKKLVEKIRKLLPGSAIRTSLIVGFPSETDKEFRELADFIEDARFERLGAFIYSPQEATAAAGLRGQVSQKIKQERFDVIMSKQQKISASINQGLLGKTLEVLIDECEDDHYLGRTQFDAPEVDGTVYVRSSQKLNPGEFVQVKIVDTLEYDLVGQKL